MHNIKMDTQQISKVCEQYWVQAVIVIAVVLYLVRRIYRAEINDTRCPEGNHTVDRSECRDGNGIMFQGTDVSPDDKCPDLSKKLYTLATACDREVTWRRCMLISIAGVSTVSVLVLPQPMGWREYFLSIVIVFCMLYFYHSYYKHHHYDFFREKLIQISERMCDAEKQKF